MSASTWRSPPPVWRLVGSLQSFLVAEIFPHTAQCPLLSLPPPGPLRRLVVWKRALHLLRGFGRLVLWGDGHYVGGDADWMGHQGQQVPQPCTRPQIQLSRMYTFLFSFGCELVFLCYRRVMGSGTTNTPVRMMAAGSLSGTMLAVNLTLIPAGRRVRGIRTIIGGNKRQDEVKKNLSSPTTPAWLTFNQIFQTFFFFFALK